MRTLATMLTFILIFTASMPPVHAQEENDTARLLEEIATLREENARLKGMIRMQKRGVTTLTKATRTEGPEYSVLSKWDNLDIDTLTLATKTAQIDIGNADAISGELALTDTLFRLGHTPEVEKYIRIFSQKKRRSMPGILERFASYEPMFRKTFDSHGVPRDLMLLSVIESAVTTRAVSKAGAAGMWQLMPQTARKHGLAVNYALDERFDPTASTRVAAEYLRNSYGILGDWTLVALSYNCGIGRVQEAVKLNGGKTDFKSLSRYLPQETRDYLPALVAVIMIWKDREMFNL